MRFCLCCFSLYVSLLALNDNVENTTKSETVSTLSAVDTSREGYSIDAEVEGYRPVVELRKEFYNHTTSSRFDKSTKCEKAYILREESNLCKNSVNQLLSGWHGRGPTHQWIMA